VGTRAGSLDENVHASELDRARIIMHTYLEALRNP